MKNVVTKSNGKVAKAKNWLMAKKALLTAFLVSVMCDVNMMTAYAGQTQQTAESKWDAVINFILPWITRLGGVVILIGAVEFGLAFKNDDAEGKTKGLRTVIAGCIVFAVGLSSDIFLA